MPPAETPAKALPALVITADDLAAMVQRRVDEVLTGARIGEIAAAAIGARIGRLTLEEARPHLQCKSERQLRECCAKYGISIRKLGQKKEWIALADIEAALTKREQLLPARESRRGTAIGPAPALSVVSRAA